MAQDLDPRAYARIPVNVTVVVAGFSYSTGGIVTDATLPLEDLNAKIGAPSLAVVRSFSLFGKTAQVSAALPYAWGDASATISGVPAKYITLRLERHALQVLMVISWGRRQLQSERSQKHHERQYWAPVSA